MGPGLSVCRPSHHSLLHAVRIKGEHVVMRQNRTVKAGGVILALALAATGCGSSRSGGTDTGGGSPSPATSAATFGDLASPCGPGAAKGATDQGVTATTIQIGYGDDRGFAA